MTEQEWQRRAARLVDELIGADALPDPAWQRVFRLTPRHVFVPEHGLDEAYGPNALVTQTRPAQVAGSDDVQLPTSSASSPVAVAVMLDRLNVAEGHRVLEIGTGTGYNTALLCARLGEANVVSIDIDDGLVATAEARLAELGYRPALFAGDGHAGVPSRAPYDAIIATCAIGCVPPAWIAQLATGGRVIAPMTSAYDGPLAVLTKTGEGELVGYFDPERLYFMPLRADLDHPLATPRVLGAMPPTMPAHGTTAVDPRLLVDPDPDLALFCHLHLPGMTLSTTHWSDGRDTISLGDDVGIAEATLRPVSPSSWTVVQQGQHRLWDTVEHAIRLWRHLGEPRRDRLGITAPPRAEAQHVWLDAPDGPYRWPLPL